MGAVRGIAVGVVGLSLLEVVVANDQAAGRLGGVFTATANGIRAFVSADVPAIRDRSGCVDTAPGAGGHAPAHHGPSLSPWDFLSPLPGWLRHGAPGLLP